MNFTLQTLPQGAALLAAALVVLLLFGDWRRIDWKTLVAGPLTGRLLGAAVAAMLLWTMSAPLQPGYGLHLLGATTAVLVFGRRLALVALAIGSLAAWLAAGREVAAWPFNFAVLALMPAWLAAAADRWLQAHLPNNYFVFLFLNACLVSAATVMTAGFLAVTALALGGAPLAPLLDDLLPYFLLLSFAEAWLTGMVITLLVVWTPGWVASFDDEKYLFKK